MSKSCCQTFWNLLDALQRPHAIRFHYTWTSFDYQHSSCLLIILHTVNRVWYSLSRLSSFRMHNTYYVLFCKLTVCFHLLFLTYSRLFSLSKWYLHIKFVLSSCKLFYLPYIQLDWMSSVSRWKIHSKKKNVTARATTIPRPPMESSRQGESKYFVYIFVWSFFNSYFLSIRKGSQQKYTRQIWIHPVKYSSAEVSDPYEVPRFVRELIFNVGKEVKLICMRSIISPSRI